MWGEGGGYESGAFVSVYVHITDKIKKKKQVAIKFPHFWYCLPRGFIFNK